MKPFFRMVGIVGLLLAHVGWANAERIADAPKRYFNDYAGVVSHPTADRLNTRLEQFERESSNQLVVAIYPKMESASSVADYTVRIAQAWHVGQKEHSNGVVLFAFMQEHKLYMQVGYGLEARIPDAIAKRIIEREIVPRFRSQDIDGGMTAAVEAMIAATKGEYRGTGSTRAETSSSPVLPQPSAFGFIFACIVVLIIVGAIRRARNPSILMNPRRRGSTWIDLGGSASGGLFGGGSFGGGGGGGDFSGGGGDFGGGGAGGSW